MKDEQSDALLEYFADLVSRLGAPQFELSVGMQPVGGADQAAIFLRDNEDSADLHVPADFFAKSSADQRRDLVHEALHLVLDRGARAWEDAIDDLTPAGFDNALNRTPRRLYERSVEQLARHLCQLFPLPDLPR